MDFFWTTQIGLVLSFLFFAGCIVWSGTLLSEYGGALGERTKIGSGMAGLIFLAAITSLPELVVSLTSVLKESLAVSPDMALAVQENHFRAGADLAVGNMLGSNVFNLMIIVVLDAIYRKGALIGSLRYPHTQPTVYGLIMLAVFVASYAFAKQSGVVLPFISCGALTLLLPVSYLVLILREQKSGEPEEEEEANQKLVQMSAARFYSAVALLALVIVGSGICLSVLGGRMALPAEQGGFGLEESFIGSIFLAISTSLPELVVGISAVRLGFLDMAAANVLGSNMFNLLIVFACDVGLRQGSLLRYASPSHLVTTAMIVVLTALVLISLRLKPRRTVAGISGISWIMLAVYILGSYILFRG
ncbi:sodium:calcium antiporter [Verrucomicrobiota bacterium]